MQKVRLTALSLQCSSAPPSVLAGRSCAHFADAGVPGLSCCCCALRPALRCRSCARCPSRWAIALRRHVRSCSPRAVHRTHPLDPACAGLDERGYPTRCGGSSGMQILPRTQCLTIKFSRGCAPHPLSQKPRFSLYHNKVLHLLADGLRRGRDSLFFM